MAAGVNGSSGSATATRELPGLDAERERAGVAEEAGGDAVRHGRVGGKVGRAGEGKAGQGGVCAGEVALGHEAELDQHLVEPLTALGRDPAPALDRPHIAMPVGDEQGSERVHRVGRNGQVHHGRRVNSRAADRRTLAW